MKTFFTVISPDSSISTLDPIVEFAADNDAHLHILVLSIAVAYPVTVFPGVPSYGGELAYELAVNRSRMRADEIEEHFKKQAISINAQPMCQPIMGVADAIGKSALYSDLAVLPAMKEFSPDLYRRTLEGVLFEAELPTIVLPNVLPKALRLDSVLVAWYPSGHTARAIRSALPLLKEECKVQIAVVDSTAIVYGPNPGDDIARYLARKKLNVQVDRISGNGKSVSNSLKQAAIDSDVDVVVMGAYGHSRMRETLFGGATMEMLENPPCALLMCH